MDLTPEQQILGTVCAVFAAFALLSVLVFFLKRRAAGGKKAGSSEDPGEDRTSAEDEAPVRRSTRARKEPTRYEVETLAATPKKPAKPSEGEEEEFKSAPKTPKTPSRRKSTSANAVPVAATTPGRTGLRPRTPAAKTSSS